MRKTATMKESQKASPYSDIPHVRKCLTVQSTPMSAALQIAVCHDMPGF
jgi:hypothetical protein